MSENTDTSQRTRLGKCLAKGQDIFISQAEMEQSLHVLGENGTGKTNLICDMVTSNIAEGNGIGLLEPHGDLTNAVLANIPRQRLKDVILWDIEDYSAPFGINVFATVRSGTIKTRAASASFISHVFERIWEVGTDTPRLSQNIRAVTRTMLETPGMTLAEVPLLYTNPAVRSRLLSRVKNPQIHAFWEEYTKKNQRDRDQFSESFLNKVTAFLDEPMICNIFAQAKSSLDLRRVMDERKILLVKLSPQFSEASALIGSVLIGQLLMAAFSRADTLEPQRVRFNLYCDEWHRFATDDMATLISEARKFRISTILSNQTLAQLPRQARAAVLAAGTLIIFRISGEDSVVICKNFDATPLKTEVIGSEPLRAPVMGILDHLMRRGHNNATISAFITDYLLPLQSVLQVVGNHLHPFEFGSAECHAVHVLEGRRLLNDALYQCMQTGRSDIFVDPQALWVLAGAANDGSSDVLHPHMKRTLLSGASFLGLEASANYLGDPRFLKDQATVAWLLKRHAKRRWWDSLFEYRWVYPGPAFVRMLTALRQTMEVLAREPVLVDVGQYQAKYQIRQYQDMENQIRNELSSLPNYECKVRILTKEYLIRTYPAPQGLSGKDLAERVSFIKAQMRFLGYVRDYQEVEKEIEKRQSELRRTAGRGDLPPRRRRRGGDEGGDPPPTHG